MLQSYHVGDGLLRVLAQDGGQDGAQQHAQTQHVGLGGLGELERWEQRAADWEDWENWSAGSREPTGRSCGG